MSNEQDFIARAGQQAGFHHLLGTRLVEWDRDRVVLELAVRPELLNLGGVVHGGVLSTLVDSACGFAGAWSPEPGHVRKSVTLSLTTNFTGQVTEGTLRAVGRKVAGGRRIYTGVAEVFNDAGELVATGQGTFRYRSGSESETGVKAN